ncbi:uncharacterized protein I303_106209 [Kwoniella dejecticola CBS 10117]|uniref:Uncharacterized protein n=1 Tax=Kwoniella dejecticola CBS 10117 TaxID=1296121 RepID=A0A1A6A1K4_9TREE|nr:uncharacterized protein I303_06228 [Kwoniella dejecticola CBS 10117]OBR83941.1 hypothetical protein I303_06228 [Kwoniella dejecticola CBS 10117]
MSSSAAQHALEQARKLMSQALGPKSLTSDKRKFQEHLITLPSYPEYENKAFFGTLVPKLFGEFEDLQDAAIDALLDLCEDEDEKVRIIGIKGLGPTGRADPRWVRGNAGVLLQLLACQPRELKYVKDSLHMLLSVSPAEVFSVMIDDCRNPEEDTGASRKNILKYLEINAAEQRKELLENGRHPEVEETLRNGLFDILTNANEEESKLIIGLLEPMSSISGKNSTEESRARYLKALINSIPSKSSASRVQDLIIAFKRYTEKAAPVDPRLAVLLLARYGEMVIKQGMGENDFSLRWIFHKMKEWTGQAIDKWSEKGNDRDLEEESLAPAFVRTILPPLLGECKTLIRRGNLSSMANIVEPVLYALYRFSTICDRRFQLVHRVDREDLLDLAKESRNMEKRAQKGSIDAEKWGNIVDMAEVLADDRSKVIKIKPSWESIPSSSRSQPPPPSGPSNRNRPVPPSRPANDLPPGPRIADPPKAPRGPRSVDLPAGPRGTQAGSGPPSYNARNPPSGPSGSARPIPSEPSSSRLQTERRRSPERRARSPDRQAGTLERRPRSPERIPRSPARRPRSPERRARSPERRPKSPERRQRTPEIRPRLPGSRAKSPDRRPKSPGIRPRSPQPVRRTGVSSTRSPRSNKPDNPRDAPPHQQRPPTSPVLNGKSVIPPLSDKSRPISISSSNDLSASTSEKVIKVLPTNEGPASLSIRNSANVTAQPPSSHTPTSNPLATSASTAPSLSIRSSKPSEDNSNPTPSTSRVSLADRLGTPALTSSAKRPREADDSKLTQTNDRLTEVKQNERPSLLSRLGSKDRDGEMPQAKRPKEATPDRFADKNQEKPIPQSSESGRVSLLDRINGKPNLSSPRVQPQRNNDFKPSFPSSVPTKPTAHVNGSDPSQSSSKGISILNRSTVSTSSSPQPPTMSMPTQDKGMSILSHSSSFSSTKPPVAPKGFSILNRASSASGSSELLPNLSSETDKSTEEVVRKGRGFREKTPDMDIVMHDAVPASRPGDLVDRLSNGNGNGNGNGSAEGNTSGGGFGIRGIRGRGGSNVGFGGNRSLNGQGGPGGPGRR